jgi:Family of unknown function (DUF5522)
MGHGKFCGMGENSCMDREKEAPQQPSALEPEDYYFEGPYMVFTAAYHLKRGYCCGSGCRHCPYRDQQEADQQDN